MSLTIRIIRPSSREKDSSLLHNLDSLRESGFEVLFDDSSFKGGLEWTSNSTEIRALELNSALLESQSDIILCARGGYGASDLLPLIEWDKLKNSREKPVIGFSDICALQSALYSKLKWQGVHAPMPLTSYWCQNGKEDFNLLLSSINSDSKKIEIPLNSSLKTTNSKISGWMFGGCFSVLTNLIGSDYFPESLAGSILILEDISEHPARILRCLNQWIQSSAIIGVKAIVLGKFFEPEEDQSLIHILKREIENRTGLPVFTTDYFGHQSPNYPVKIASEATIENDSLVWNL